MAHVRGDTRVIWFLIVPEKKGNGYHSKSNAPSRKLTVSQCHSVTTLCVAVEKVSPCSNDWITSSDKWSPNRDSVPTI